MTGAVDVATEALNLDAMDEHPALAAARELGLAPDHATRVEPLKERPRASVYRLVGAGPAGTNLIAKHCSAETARTECRVYDELLPRLRLASLRSWGVLERHDGTSWLFLEDAGTEEASGLRPHHAPLLARWLARLHGAGESFDPRPAFATRGIEYYARCLQSATEALRRSLDDPALEAEPRRVLAATVAHLDVLGRGWPRVELAASAWRPTFVHGDFVSKNLRVRPTDQALLAFDWEQAGWGVPAVDLVEFRLGRAGAGLAAYAAAASRGGAASPGEAERMADVGTLLWVLTVLSAESRSLAGAWAPRAIDKIAVYHDWLDDAMHALGL